MSRYIALHPPLLLLGASLVATLATPLAWVPVILFAADVYGRNRDYGFLSLQPAEFFTERTIAAYGRSWCGRAVMSSAIQIDWRSRGYRWFHILPDDTISTNSPLLKPKFWRNLALGHSKPANDNSKAEKAA